MERKLNPGAFWRRLWKHDKFCTISTAQYWDWITYLDVKIFSAFFNSDSLPIGRLPYRVGGAQDEGIVLLAASRDEWTVRSSHYLRMGTYLPLDGPHRQVKRSRLDVEIPRCHDCRHFPRCPSLQLVETLSRFP